MNRTDELLEKGARERGSSGGAPFLKWPDKDYAWIEGQVLDHWTGKYGDAVVMRITATGGAELEMKGKDEDGTEFVTKVEPGVQANIGLNLSMLKGTVLPDDRGKRFHIAFEGYQVPQSGGDPYRVFRVLEIDPENGDGQQPPQTEAITNEQAAKLWRIASETLDGDPMGAEQAFRHLVADVLDTHPDTVTLKKIRHADMPKIMNALEKYESPNEDDLPF